MTAPFPSSGVAVGYAKETTLGTAVTATKFLPVKDITIVPDPQVIIPEVARQNPASRPYGIAGIQKVAGNIVAPLFPDVGCDFLAGAFGGDTISGIGPYVHTIASGRPLHSFTVEKNIGGNNIDEQYAGCVVSKAVLKFALNAEPEATYTFEGQRYVVLATATSPTWPTDVPYGPTQTSLSLAGTVDPTVQSIEITIDNAAKAFPAFNGQTYPQYVAGLTRKVSAKVTAILQALNGGAGAAFGYFADLTAVPTRAIVATVTDGTNSIALTLPKAVLTKYSDPIKIGDLVMVDLTYEALLDATNGDLKMVITNQQSVAY